MNEITCADGRQITATPTVAALIADLGLTNPTFCVSCGELFQLTDSTLVIKRPGARTIDGHACGVTCAAECNTHTSRRP